MPAGNREKERDGWISMGYQWVCLNVEYYRLTYKEVLSLEPSLRLSGVGKFKEGVKDLYRLLKCFSKYLLYIHLYFQENYIIECRLSITIDNNRL